jgi:hypothetical protein
VTSARAPFIYISPAGPHINLRTARQWNIRNIIQGRDRRRRRFRCLALRRPGLHRHIHLHHYDPAGAIGPPKLFRSARNAASTLPATSSHCTRPLTARSLRIEKTSPTDTADGTSRTPAKWQVQRNPALTQALQRHFLSCRILRLLAIQT